MKYFVKTLWNKIRNYVLSRFDPEYSMEKALDDENIAYQGNVYHLHFAIAEKGTIFCLFSNVNDLSDYFFCKKVSVDGSECYCAFESDEESETATRVIQHELDRRVNATLEEMKAAGEPNITKETICNRKVRIGDRNAMSKKPYIILHTLFMVGYCFYTWWSVYRPVDWSVDVYTILIDWCSFAAIVLIGVMLTWERRRNYMNLTANFLSAEFFDVYRSLINHGDLKLMLIPLLPLLPALVYGGIVIFRKMSLATRRTVSLEYRIIHALYGMRVIFFLLSLPASCLLLYYLR